MWLGLVQMTLDSHRFFPILVRLMDFTSPRSVEECWAHHLVGDERI